jgi:endonuclease YncB( thermonuclease family)
MPVTRIPLLEPFRWRAFACLIATVVPVLAQNADDGRKIRNVTPENIPVIILPARPDSKTGQKQKHSEPIPGSVVFATVSDDGTITADGNVLNFTGVKRIASDALCESANGRWACGLRAFVALRNLVHGKEIKCEVLPRKTHSRCYRDRTDVSEWLLGEGWALYDDTAEDENLAAAARNAEKNARGIWANGSRPIVPRR